MKLLRWMNVVAFVATLVVNGLANALPLNGQTTGGVSDSFDVLFTPAGYVFSIWGLIYLLLGIFSVYQILPGQREADFVKRIGWWFVASSVFNITWLFMWHYNLFVLSEVAMLGLLVSLLAIYLRLGIGRRTVVGREKWLVNLPFSIYLGWISVATIANTAVVLYDLNWNGFGIAPEVWTAIVLLVGGLLGVLMALIRKEVAYPLVVIWAFVGVVVRRMDTPLVAVTAGLTALVVLLVLVISLLRRKPEMMAQSV